MTFLDQLDESSRRRFEAAGQPLRIPRGTYLMRRGEAGGDIFLIQSGKVEVVDSRRSPEVILAVLSTGVMVGELSFVDGSPRSADVRAAVDCQVLQWPRQDLVVLLNRHPDLAAAFYRALARLASERARTATFDALSGAIGSASKVNASTGSHPMRDDARTLADATKESLLDIETRLRREPADAGARQALNDLLDGLQDHITTLATSYPEPGATETMARVLGRELHPYLVRSALAERAIRRPQGVTATPEILAHVLVGVPGGDGHLGELIDRWLLERPTLQALRASRQAIVDLVSPRLPTHRNRRVLLLNAGTGSLVAGLLERLDHPPTVLTVIDQSRDALAFLDTSVVSGSNVEILTIQENLAQFALGRRRTNIVQQDVVIVQGLAEYLPSRLVVSMLRALGRLLVPGGSIVLTSLGPSRDEALLTHLLRWPTIRRTSDELHRLFDAGWVNLDGEVPLMGPGSLFHGTPDPEMTARSTYFPAVASRGTPH